MTAQPQPTLDFDALVAMENASPIRHEYIGGRLYAMADGTVKHAHIITNLTTAIHSRLRGKRCRGASGDQRVRTSATATNWYYPAQRDFRGFIARNRTFRPHREVR